MTNIPYAIGTIVANGIRFTETLLENMPGHYKWIVECAYFQGYNEKTGKLKATYDLVAHPDNNSLGDKFQMHHHEFITYLEPATEETCKLLAHIQENCDDED